MSLALEAIHQGDCLELLPEMEPESIDLAFADPPFNIGYKYDVYEDRQSYDSYCDWSAQWMAAVARLLKPHGTFWLAIGDEFAAELKVVARRELGLTCRSWVVWYYTFGVNCTKKFSRSHVHLFHFVKNPRTFTFNAQEPKIRVPSARRLVYADGRAHPDGRLPDDTWILRPQDVPDGFGADQDTWYYPRVAGTFKERRGFHGCQMPEQVLGRIVRASSNTGDVVLDPFTGSGTTLAVAKKLGRRWVGCELSMEYAQNATKRLTSIKEGDALDGSDEPLYSVPSTKDGKRRDSGSNNHAPLNLPELVVSNHSGAKSRAFNAQQNGISLEREKTRVQKVVRQKRPRSLSEVELAVVSAYMEIGHEYSSDWVLADPELNVRFLQMCKRKGVPGAAAEINRFLIRLRKANKLPRKGPYRRVSKYDSERFSFAAEVALRQISDEYSDLSLDYILCDPTLAARFDGFAKELAVKFSSFHCRWQALHIRKRSDDWKEDAKLPEIRQFLNDGRLPRRLPLTSAPCSALRDVPGVYILRNHRYLFVGESLDLGSRLAFHIDLMNTSRWAQYQVKDVNILRLDELGIDEKLLWGLKSALIPKYNTPLNWRGLAA